MAHTTLRSLGCQALSLFSVLVLIIEKGMAYEFKVGGLNGWMPPPNPYTNSFNQWAERNRFLAGDSLVFAYPADKDSLLYVTENDYLSCNVSNPIQKFIDGRTVFKLDHSGHYYFISGVRDSCLKNEKMVVIVLSDKNKNATAPPPETATAPPPSNATGTAPAPSNATQLAAPPPSEPTISPLPSPSAETPAGEAPPSPPPNGETEINPSPTPSEETKPDHKNDASSNVKNLFVLLAGLVGSSVLVM